MDLNFTDQQKSIQKAAKELCEKEISPAAGSVDARVTLAHEHLKKIAAAGLLCCIVPVEYGGGGAGLIAHSLCMEELAAACASTSLAAHASGLLAAVPLLLSSDEHKRKFLPRLASADMIGCFALTEPGCGSDIAAIETTAKRTDGGYVINGVKTFITNGPVADVSVVFARSGDQDDGPAISAFMVERGADGLTSDGPLEMMCARGAAMSSLVFKDCEIPAANLIGEEGQGMDMANLTREYARISMAAIAIGIARAAMEESISHAETRRAFGKLIGSFQEVNHKIATMRMNIEVARQLLYYAAWLKDRGEKCDTDISIAKLFASEIAARSASDALQIHGGSGLTVGSKVERLFRDVKMCEIAEGTSEIQRMAIARSVLAE